jgi:hypothetical protein
MTPSNRDRFRFYKDHRPEFEAGDYRLTVTLQQQGAKIWGKPEEPRKADETSDKPDNTSTSDMPVRTAEFSVAGDRFTLHPALLRSCYPPPSAHGAFDGVLPHVIFHRSTLPWEREAGAGGKGKASDPWLALLLFRGYEAPGVTNKKASALEVKLELGDDPDQPVSLIEVDAAQLPTPAEGKFLAHAREVEFVGGGDAEVAGDDADVLDGGDHSEVEAGGAPNSEICAVVVGNRIVLATETPQPWVVHLVSLEHRLPSAGGDKTRVVVVSLFHWEFVANPGEADFDGTVRALDRSAFRLPAEVLPTEVPPRAKTLLDRGSVPLPHHLREGGGAVSWYRGPLLPWTTNADPPVELPLPARSSDSLSLFEPELDMLDVSYATAWELGRLSALADRGFALRLTDWKRARARSASRLRGELDVALLPHPAVDDPKSAVSALPVEVRRFLAGLATLRAVPPSHLVPHPLLLPENSMRIVRVDTTWVECLLDGALSIGRHSAHEAARDAHVDAAVPRGSLGVLLRTPLVDHHPELEVRGWRKVEGGEARAIRPVCDRTLGAGVRLVCFSEDPDTVTVGLPPTVLHFGFTVTRSEGTVTGLTIERRVANGSGPPVVEETKLHGAEYWDASGRVHLDQIAALVAGGSVDRLAADLMESAPCVTFELGADEPPRVVNEDVRMALSVEDVRLDPLQAERMVAPESTPRGGTGAQRARELGWPLAPAGYVWVARLNRTPALRRIRRSVGPRLRYDVASGGWLREEEGA